MENEPPQMEDKKSPTTAGLSPGGGLVNFTDCHGAITGACRKLLGKDQSQTPKVSSCAQDSAKGALNLQVCPAYCKLTCECNCPQGRYPPHGYKPSPGTISADSPN